MKNDITRISKASTTLYIVMWSHFLSLYLLIRYYLLNVCFFDSKKPEKEKIENFFCLSKFPHTLKAVFLIGRKDIEQINRTKILLDRVGEAEFVNLRNQ